MAPHLPHQPASAIASRTRLPRLLARPNAHWDNLAGALVAMPEARIRKAELVLRCGEGLANDRRSLLSEGVLANDPVVTNRKKIAAEDIDPAAIERGAGQSPLGYPVVIGDDEVTAIAPVRVRHRVEHRRTRP